MDAKVNPYALEQLSTPHIYVPDSNHLLTSVIVCSNTLHKGLNLEALNVELQKEGSKIFLHTKVKNGV